MMTSKPKGLRLPETLQAEIEREMERRATPWSATLVELLDEAIRMRRAPGIVLADGPAGKRAVVAGTGLDVWEVVAMWREVGRDYARLRSAYEWVPEPQLRGALAYYELYGEEIDRRLAQEADWSPERLQRELPFTTPRG
jgi:uncharacterized protein (DUF433 family)